MLNSCQIISISLHWYKNGNSIFMLQCMKKIDANVNRPSNKQEIVRRDSKTYWPININKRFIVYLC